MLYLKQHRLHKQKTAQQVADALGMPLQTVCRHENSQRIYSDTLVRYATYYECSVDDLLNGPPAA